MCARDHQPASPEKTTPMPCSPVYAGSLYPCDLTDAEWALLAPLLPAPARRGRPRSWPLRLLVNALFYVLRTGCAWRYLPRGSCTATVRLMRVVLSKPACVRQMLLSAGLRLRGYRFT